MTLVLAMISQNSSAFLKCGAHLSYLRWPYGHWLYFSGLSSSLGKCSYGNKEEAESSFCIKGCISSSLRNYWNPPWSSCLFAHWVVRVAGGVVGKESGEKWKCLDGRGFITCLWGKWTGMPWPIWGKGSLVRAFFTDNGRVDSAPSKALCWVAICRGVPGSPCLHLLSRCPIQFNVCPKYDAPVVSPCC